MTSPAARPGHDLTDTPDRESVVHGYTIALWWAPGTSSSRAPSRRP
ncbi:hypothetical protein [Streptomyces sp. DSM 40750]|nr:hypothetical protein [Streptomyces sp. DSM 40750]UUU23113.1 hypothetical protein JIX55_24045 [Streptomyces sp. DSM 40750]